MRPHDGHHAFYPLRVMVSALVHVFYDCLTYYDNQLTGLHNLMMHLYVAEVM